MKTFPFNNLAVFAVCIWGATVFSAMVSVRAAEAPALPGGSLDDPVTLKTLHEEIRSMRSLLEEQSRKINRLYNAVEPELAEVEERAEAARRRSEMDAALKMDQVCKVSDAGLTSVAQFSPVEDLFAVISGSGAIALYDVTGKLVRELRRPDEYCTCIAYAPDGKRLLAGTRSGKLLLWDLADSTSSVVFEQPAKITRVAWLPQPDRGVFFVEVPTGEQKKYLEEKKTKPSAFVVDLASGKLLVPILSMARSDYQSISASLDGKRLAVLELSGKERGAFVLESASGAPTATLFNQKYSSGTLSVCIAPDNQTVAVGYAPYHLSIWDGATGRQLRLIEGHVNWVVALAFSTDGRKLISGSGDSTARVWDVKSGAQIGCIRFDGSSTYVKSVAFSHDGKLVLAAAENGQLVLCKTPGQATPEAMK